jgi:hypothetical protein
MFCNAMYTKRIALKCLTYTVKIQNLVVQF